MCRVINEASHQNISNSSPPTLMCCCEIIKQCRELETLIAQKSSMQFDAACVIKSLRQSSLKRDLSNCFVYYNELKASSAAIMSNTRESKSRKRRKIFPIEGQRRRERISSIPVKNYSFASAILFINKKEKKKVSETCVTWAKHMEQRLMLMSNHFGDDRD